MVKLMGEISHCIPQGEVLGDLSSSFLIFNNSEAKCCIKKLLNSRVLKSGDSQARLYVEPCMETKESVVNALIMIMNIHVYSEIIWTCLIMATLKLLSKITADLLLLLLVSCRYVFPPFSVWLHRCSHRTQCCSRIFFFNLNHCYVSSFVRPCFPIYGR